MKTLKSKLLLMEQKANPDSVFSSSVMQSMREGNNTSFINDPKEAYRFLSICRQKNSQRKRLLHLLQDIHECGDA